MLTLKEIGINAVCAKRFLACVQGNLKNKALNTISSALIDNSRSIIKANLKDLENGKKAGLSSALLDRLSLSEDRVRSMAEGVNQIAAMDDPVGRTLSGATRPNGLRIQKVSVPLGVIAVIYEARPNVSSDAAALCLKAGNAVILRGGKEAIYSNKAIVEVMRDALENAGLPKDCIQLVEDTSRKSANALMKLNEYVDVLIPRGGAGLINAVMENSTIPVIETGVGNCHTYVDCSADLNMAAEIVFNAKTSRPSVCNACETVLIHRDIAKKVLPEIVKRLREKNVVIKGDAEVCSIIRDASAAEEEDWSREYLDYIIAAKIVGSLDEAIEHITRYGSGHSECIITENHGNAMRFLNEVDAAAVYVNASTRFTDGGEFGFGAEIGISTQKLHARGPLGLEKLTSEKYIIFGNGQIR
ncbi:MAG: glutamate-5-semialdehyde dehydrogenase [Acutalibacteraceae bacterium]|jgi:glutamate-5-semialdehyde dehydrogenase